jgi:hypothetical protein
MLFDLAVQFLFLFAMQTSGFAMQAGPNSHLFSVLLPPLSSFSAMFVVVRRTKSEDVAIAKAKLGCIHLFSKYDSVVYFYYY